MQGGRVMTHIRHLVRDNHTRVGLDRNFNVLTHHPRAATTRRHRTRICIGQGYLMVRSRFKVLADWLKFLDMRLGRD